MPTVVPGAYGGPRARLRAFVCGERPGREEAAAGVGFVGPAGEELWQRLDLCAGLHRDECYITNLVKTLSYDPPTPAEIAHWAPELRRELRDVQPDLIVTVGYHAARWFLPQFRDWPGDYFHGLAFRSPRCPSAIALPLVHSSAALRQPDLYQRQFTADCRALGALLALPADRRARRVHRPHPLVPVSRGLAGMAGASILGVDTEGEYDDPQAITVSPGGRDAALLEPGRHTLGALGYVLSTAERIAIHNALHDWRVLARLQLPLPAGRVVCTQAMAYCLDLPQSLKVLAYRLFGWELSEYTELVTPLDDALVRGVLEAAHATFTRSLEVQSAKSAHDPRRAHARDHGARSGNRRATEAARPAAVQGAGERRAADQERARGGPQAPEASPARAGQAVAARREIGRPSGADQVLPQAPPRRALTSLRSILDKDAEKSRRARWLASKFASLVPLPPAPSWRDLPTDVREPYALADAIAHRHTAAALLPRLRSLDLLSVYRIDMGILPFLARNADVGMAVDVDGLRALTIRFTREYEKARAELNALAGRDVNPHATEDIGETLFEDWGVTPTRLTRTGLHTTADKYLKARKDEHEGVPLVIKCRQLKKFTSTYTTKLPRLLHHGRYHPDWKYTRTASGRVAEQIIVLIPKHDPTAKAENRMNRAHAIRDCFYATDGHTLVSCDLSQIEMRVMAHESRDPLFLKAFAEGIDFHAQTAHHLLGAPKRKEDQDESKHRLPSKTLNFSVLMGTTEYGLCDQLHEQGQANWCVDWPEDDADGELELALRAQGFQSTREFLREWFKLYRGVQRWIDERKAEAQRTGYVRDLWRRRIDVSGIWSTNEHIAAEFARKAHAIPIQAGAIGIAKRWAARIFRTTIAPRLRDARRYCEPWVWLHDDVTLETDTRIRRAVTQEMLACVPQDLCVPVTADSKHGERWGSLH